MSYADRWETVNVEVDDGIAWVELNRPEKRNAMSPTLNAEMVEVLEALDADDDCGVLVLTGAGEAWSAGMDLKEYFREVDGGPEHVAAQGAPRRRATGSGGCCAPIAKPTIAMVNGWCFGGAFTPLVACDLAIAADEATFGLSEINWGIPPGSVVSKALADTVGSRDGAPLRHDRPHLRRPQGRRDGPRQRERARWRSCAPRSRRSRASCSGKNPVVLRAAKLGFKHCRRHELGPGRGLPLRQARAVAVPRRRARPRAGARRSSSTRSRTGRASATTRADAGTRQPGVRTLALDAHRCVTNGGGKERRLPAVA